MRRTVWWLAWQLLAVLYFLILLIPMVLMACYIYVGKRWFDPLGEMIANGLDKLILKRDYYRIQDEDAMRALSKLGEHD